MQFTLFALAAFAASVAAQDLSQIPECALPCLLGADTSGCSGPTDIKCLCAKPEFVATTTKCIQGACTNPSELEKANSVSRQTCEAAGVTLPDPSASASSSASASASASSGASSSASAPTTSATTPASTPAASPAASGNGNGAISNSFSAVAGLAAFGLAALAL
ncbi:hypothetical protein HGRIS_012162 [Hohenbuehelia grisea]|uniref:CFEM domain-containing protein n=1 Tax=Hohenbuehelia grisea TaxID=104357 RepID=A0ABR3IRH2_9AGAR